MTSAAARHTLFVLLFGHNLGLPSARLARSYLQFGLGSVVEPGDGLPLEGDGQRSRAGQ